MMTIGLILATPLESRPVLARCRTLAAGDQTSEQWGDWIFHSFSIGQLRVVAVQSGPGMVNAAAATAALLLQARPNALLHGGVAGAHAPDLWPGDLVLAERVCAPGNGRLEGGTIAPIYGMRWYDSGGQKWRFDTLAAHHALFAVLARATQEMIAQEGWHALVVPDGTADRLARWRQGTIASADTWTRDAGAIARLHGMFGSLCEEMEGAAVAQIAARHQLPWGIVRCISNNDWLGALGQDAQRALYPPCADRAAAVLARTVQLLAEAPAATAQLAPEPLPETGRVQDPHDSS